MSDTSPQDYNEPVVDFNARRFASVAPSRLGSGDGPPPGLEGRVAKVEAHVENIREALPGLRGDVGTLRVDVATIRENVRHLPTKGFIVTSVLLALAVGTGVLTIAPKLQQWAGTAPPAPVAAPAPTTAPPTQR